MLVPDIKSIKENENKSYTVYIEDDGSPNGSLYNYEILTDMKERDKFIKSIERIIRQSFEYKSFIGMLKNVYNYTYCTFFKGIDINETRVPIEFHHYPFTLYDLVSIEVEHEIELEHNDIDLFEIANRIMKYHYQLIVGLVPLSETVHELVHDGKKFINIKDVKGDFQAYLDKYNDKIPEEFKEKIDNLKYLSKQEDEGVNIDGDILKLNMLDIINEDEDGDELYYIEMDEDEKKTETAIDGDYDNKTLEDFSNESVKELLDTKSSTKKKKKKKEGNDN